MSLMRIVGSGELQGGRKWWKKWQLGILVVKITSITKREQEGNQPGLPISLVI